jgi:hypothetical protein
MVYHFNNRKRFQTYQGDMKKWQKEVDQLKYFALKRDNSLWSQLKKKFNLSAEYKLTINIKNPENGKVYLNNNELQSTIFVGNFFSELGVPFCILPDLGYSFTGNIDSVPFDSHIWNNCDDLNPYLEKEITVNVSFIENKSSKSSVVINEIDYVNDCFEIFNQENGIVNLKDWKIVDKNNNIYTVEDCMLKPRGFAVFHFNEIETRINDVIYQNINFRISSSNELISIYDNNGDFVDSVSYKLTNIENSYSRNTPFDIVWENNSDLTIGYHNTFYTNILLEEQKENNLFFLEDRIFWIIGTLFVVIISVIGISLYRRRNLKLSSLKEESPVEEVKYSALHFLVTDYLVSITCGVFFGLLLLGEKYIIFTFMPSTETIPSYYQNGPVNTILIGLFVVLLFSFMFTGISRLFTKKKNRNKYSKDFKEWSIGVSIFFFVVSCLLILIRG